MICSQKRHQQDNLVNNSATEVLRDGVFVRTLWKHVKTGGIIVECIDAVVLEGYRYCEGT